MPFSLTKLTHKQLFITDCKIQWEEILISNKDLLNQVRKVLRLQKWDTVYIQNEWIRYEVEIEDWNDATLTWMIKSTIHCNEQKQKAWMIIGMPNKWDKVELIVQKLTEIWVDEIIFWPSERSVIKSWNSNKEERLVKIAREAVEQSWGWNMPIITFMSNIKEALKDKTVIVFDKTDAVTLSQAKSMCSLHKMLVGLVGPEGGLTERDYGVLEWVKYEIRGLGDTMLRTETAAIVWGWIMRNGV